MESQKGNLPEAETADEDVPSDFFDDFNKEEFMESLSVIDSWDDEGVNRRVPRIDAEAVESVKDLRELIRDGKEEGEKSAEVGTDKPRSVSQTRLNEFIKPGSRRDPSKVNAAIRRDKEAKVKEYLAKHLQSTDDLRPPGTELDDFFDEDKSKDAKTESKLLINESNKHRESPSEHSKYSSSRRHSPARRRNSPGRSPRSYHHRSPEMQRQRSPHLQRQHSPHVQRQYSPHVQRQYSPHRSYTKSRRPSPKHHSSHYRENQKRSPLKRAGRSRRYSRSPQGRRSRNRSYDRRSHHRSPYDSRSRNKSPLDRDLRQRSPLSRNLRHQSPLVREQRSRSRIRQSSYEYLQEPIPPGYSPSGPFQMGPGYGPPVGEFSGPGPMPVPVPMSGPMPGPMPGQDPGFAFPQAPAYHPPVMSGPGPYNAYAGPEMSCVPGPGLLQPVPAPMLPPAHVPALPRAPPMVPPPQLVHPASNTFHTTTSIKPYDALAQLVADGKLSKEDYLKLAPNKGVSSSLDTKTRIDVLNRCYEAISKLGSLKVPNRLLMTTTIPGVEPKALTPKFCSPLKRQAPVEFVFTGASGSAAARHNKQLLDCIVTTIGLDKILSRPKNKSKKNTKDAAVQTTKPYCDVCEIRESKEFYDASTRIDPEDFSSSVHTQVLEQDLMSSPAIFNPTMSIAHMTPAQLVSQLAARAKTLKQTDPEPRPPPPPNHYLGRRPNYDYNGRGGQQFQNNYNDYNRY